jgi:hypothetical protein
MLRGRIVHRRCFLGGRVRWEEAGATLAGGGCVGQRGSFLAWSCESASFSAFWWIDFARVQYLGLTAGLGPEFDEAPYGRTSLWRGQMFRVAGPV